MTQQEAIAEVKYQLSKFVFQVLLEKGHITEDEAVAAKIILLERYDPFTRCLEEVDSWKSAL